MEYTDQIELRDRDIPDEILFSSSYFRSRFRAVELHFLAMFGIKFIAAVRR